MNNIDHERSPQLRALESHSAASESPGAEESSTKGVQRIWTRELGQQFTALSTYFLRNYRRLGMNSTEFEFICHLISYKWGDGAPRPSMGSIAKCMGKDPRYIRKVCAGLQKKGMVRRQFSKVGGTSHYHLDGLFSKLEAQKRQDERAQVKVADAG